MATAPLLLLIVAAAPHQDAVTAPVRAALLAPMSEAAVLRAPALELRTVRNTQASPVERHAAQAPSVRSTRPALAPLIVALPHVRDIVDDAPALAPRTEPGDARGPPAL